MRKTGEQGMALLIAIFCTMLMAALGGALVLATLAERLIAANYESSNEALYAADGALERALSDIETAADWNGILDGTVKSGFVDGPASGTRTLTDGTTLDLSQTLNMLNCEQTAACAPGDMDAVVADRPWGPDNPRWQLFAYGPLANLLPAGVIRSRHYVLVFAADDQSETDHDPVHDGNTELNPGTGVLMLRADAFGPRGAHASVVVTIARPAPVPPEGSSPGGTPGGIVSIGAAHILSWREIR